MSGYYRILASFICCFALTFGQSDDILDRCAKDIEPVEDFLIELRTIDIGLGDTSLYTVLKNDYSKKSDLIYNAACTKEKKDSLEIRLKSYFAIKVVKEIGDLSRYIEELNNISKKCDSIITEREFEYGSPVEKWYRERRDAYRMEREILAKDYGELIIAFDNQEYKNNRLTGMTVVRNRSTKKPVEIHIRSPQSINDQDEKKKRLSFIQSTFSLWFSEPDPEAGYIKKIEYFPKAFSSDVGHLDQDIIDSYAFTFDNKKRYRTKMSDGHFDTLYIKKLSEWDLIEQAPPDMAIIQLPNNLKYGDPKVSGSTRSDIMDKGTYRIHLKKDMDNVEISIVDNSFRDKRHLVLRIIIVTAVTIATLLIL